MIRHESLRIFCDGGARGNPGPAAVGIVIQNSLGQTIHTLAKTIGRATNNSAEYLAVIEALTFLKQKRLLTKHIDLFLDSRVVSQQLAGVYKVKQAHLREFLLTVRSLEQEVGVAITYHHIPRGLNSQADTLLNRVLDQEI